MGTVSDVTAHQIVISGGTLYINADGDGIDSNGNLTVSGGTIAVDGPTNSGNGALDSGAESGGTISVTGGTITAVGASGMAEGFDTNSTQYSFLYNFSTTIAAGTKVTVTSSDGTVIYSGTPAKSWSSIEFSSPELQKGGTYTITAGDQTASVTLSSIATNSTTGNMTGMGGGRGTFQQAGTAAQGTQTN
jgi:hypothetical protein